MIIAAEHSAAINLIMEETRSKFNVSSELSKRCYDNIVFDSELEMKYYRDVILPFYNEGKITHYEMQKKYILQPAFKYRGKKVLPIEYKADFYLVYNNGKEQVIDIKGFKETSAKLKRKMFWYVYPDIEYLWISYSKIDGGWVPIETIEKGRSIRRKLKRKEKELKEKRGK